MSQVLDTVKWPLQENVRLHPLKYAADNVHASKLAGAVFAAPNQPTKPYTLLHCLGDKRFVQGQSLIDFSTVGNADRCVTLLAPSGAGKTRKLYELLSSKLGLFIPYKVANDKNDGSTALSSVLSLLKGDRAIDWATEEPPASVYEARREKATFATYCVLIAYSSIFDALQKRFAPTPLQWLLLQLFPIELLGRDVFDALACKLYASCNPREVLSFYIPSKKFFYVIDEAQMLGTLLPKKFMTVHERTRTSNGLRPVLSPVLGAVKVATSSLPIIAGTGLTLIDEWKSISSAMGVEADYIFTDFPMLDYEQVFDMLQRFLVADVPILEHAAKWLVGRPRWVMEFISKAIEDNKPVGPYLQRYVSRLTTTGSPDLPARTPLAGLERLGKKSVQVSVMGEEELETNPHGSFLRNAFLLSMGVPSKPVKSRLLLEFGLGFPDPEDVTKSMVQLEPLILETARLVINKTPKFGIEFLQAVWEDPSAVGNRFEFVSATRLFKSFTSQALEQHPLLLGATLPDEFKGEWQGADPMYLYGKVARSTSQQKQFYEPYPESIFFPDIFAGPDTILTLIKPGSSAVLTVFIQYKVKTAPEQAKLTVDPAKLHHDLRGKVAQLDSSGKVVTKGETARPGVSKEHKQYLSELTGPVIRVVVSALKGLKGNHVELVRNHCGSNDVQLLIDPSNGPVVYGQEMWEEIRRIRQPSS